MSPRLAVAALLVTLSACGSDDVGTNPINVTPTNGTMSAMIDGAAWTAVSIAAVNNGGTVAISGSDAAPLAIGFGVVTSTPGTFPIGPGSTATGNVIDNLTTTWSASPSQGSGSITLTTLTSTGASGTFTFTAELTSSSGSPATRVVTNGVFDVTF